MEQWKSLSGIVENGQNYEVSNQGNLRTAKGKEIKGYIKKNGYVQVDLSYKNIKKKYYLHRLVALAFIPTVEGKNEINHRDGCKLNNGVTNLEWSTRSENNSHAVNTGLRKQIGSDNHMAILNEDKVKEIKRLYREGYKQVRLAEQFNVCKQTINNIVHGKVWVHVD